MLSMAQAGASFLSVLLLCAYPAAARQEPPGDVHPVPSDILQAAPLYTNMMSYGQYMGCKAAEKNIGGPQDGWVKSPSLPGTYEEYLQGWETGFRKCRSGRGPEENPGGPVVPPGDLYP